LTDIPKACVIRTGWVGVNITC